MRLFYIILLTLVIALANAKKRSSCRREPAVLKNFDIEAILGHWYEYSRGDLDFEAGCDCPTFELGAIDASNIQVSFCCQKTGVSNETQTCDFGITKATHINPEKKEATFKYTKAESTIESHSWIVDTDYDNYMVVSGCDHVSDDEEREVFWILSRDKEINENEVQKINKVLKDNNFDERKIIKQRHGADLCTSKTPKNTRRYLHRKRQQSTDGI